MDESTRKRMEQKQFKECETDWCIALTDEKYNERLKIGWVEIIEYVYEKAKCGVARSRIKELFLRDMVDPRIRKYESTLGMVDLTEEMQNELDKYNYHDCD